MLFVLVYFNTSKFILFQLRRNLIYNLNFTFDWVLSTPNAEKEQNLVKTIKNIEIEMLINFNQIKLGLVKQVELSGSNHIDGTN